VRFVQSDWFQKSRGRLALLINMYRGSLEASLDAHGVPHGQKFVHVYFVTSIDVKSVVHGGGVGLLEDVVVVSVDATENMLCLVSVADVTSVCPVLYKFGPCDVAVAVDVKVKEDVMHL